jgi:hypothetical protein
MSVTMLRISLGKFKSLRRGSVNAQQGFCQSERLEINRRHSRGDRT